MKKLRRYEYVADKEHWCDRCCSYIRPGEYYEGLVCVDTSRTAKRLIVFKYHIRPGCELPSDPDEEIHKTCSNNIETRLKIAA